MTLGGAGATVLDLPETEAELVKAQAKRIDSDAVLRMIDALAAAEGRLRYALSKKIFFEIALVKAIKARQMVGIDGVIGKLNELKAQLAGGGTAAPSRQPAATKQTAASDKATASGAAAQPAASLEEAWEYAVEHLGKVTPLAKTYLVGTRPLGMKGNTVIVGFDPEFADRREFVDTGRNRELLQAKLREKLRLDVSLKFEIAEPGAPKAAGPVKKNPEDFKDDPLIKKALEIFKGTVVEVRQ